MSANLEKAVLDMRKKGIRVCDIARVTGASSGDIMEILKAHPESAKEYFAGKFEKKTGVPYDEAEMIVIQEYQSGKLMREIASDHGYVLTDVRHILYENRLSPSGKHEVYGVQSAKTRNEKILELRDRGFSYFEIANQLGVSPSTVKKLSRANGKGGRCTKSLIAPDVVKKVIKGRKKKKSTRAIAEEIGIDVVTVRNIIRKCNLGIPMNSKSARNETICRDFKNGVPIAEIAKKNDLQERSVYRIVENVRGSEI